MQISTIVQIKPVNYMYYLYHFVLIESGRHTNLPLD